MIGTQSTTKQPHDWWNTLAFGVAALANHLDDRVELVLNPAIECG